MTQEENMFSFEPTEDAQFEPSENTAAEDLGNEALASSAAMAADEEAAPSAEGEWAQNEDPANAGDGGSEEPQKISPESTADLIAAAQLSLQSTDGFAAETIPIEGEAADSNDNDESAQEMQPGEGAAGAQAPSLGDTADLINAAMQSGTFTGGTESKGTDDSQSSSSPASTAEIDVEAVEAKLSEAAASTDPGSTASFEPITEERIDTGSTFDAGSSLQLMWGARSDVGRVRDHNEDSYLAQSPLFAVCDGMGGHAAGEVASSIAVETIAKMAPSEADPAHLARAVEAANAAVIEAAANGLGKAGMGCTATCAYIHDTTLAIAHVGDSRAYLLHDGALIRVTHDHSFVEELVDAGEITADEARVHPNRSVITRALGSDPAMYADHFSLTIEEGDRLILCSDGLSSMIPDNEIEHIATQSPTAQICTDNLVDAALTAGGHDNVSVVVVDVVDDGRLRKIAKKRKRNIVIAASAAAAAIVLACAIGLFTIMNNVYLGVHGDNVAVYTGIHESLLGIKLYRLEDSTTIELSDLPEDTQHRLQEGIQQKSLDDAYDTISKYRKQIDDELTKKAEDAKTISDNTDDAAAEAAKNGDDGQGDENKTDETKSDASSSDENADEGGAE